MYNAYGSDFMKRSIEDRTIELANYIIENKATVRQTAKKFGVSKSTVHKDISERLPKLNRNLSNLAKEVLAQNKAERHIRGGLATKNKYAMKKSF